MSQKNMPEDWVPPYPSWSARFAPDVKEVVVGYFAVQYQGGSIEEFSNWIRTVLSIESAPVHAERASYVDTSGFSNTVFICYWTNEASYNSWASSPQFTNWWGDEARLNEPVAYWREVIFAPMSRLETLFSSEDPAGMAATASGFSGEIKEHAYWGGMRDRIPDSETNAFQCSAGDTLIAQSSVDSTNKRITISPPENMCLIRSAQNWTHCQGEELDIYQGEVHPVLIEGMDYIRDNAIDTGCIACRFMDETTMDGGKQSQTFGMAYFLTMAHLEAWARSHPTHLAIFQSFHKMVQKMEFQIELKLWHEVIVLPEGPHLFEYLNCHGNTGLLPYFPSVQ
jgi:aliphatic aldoxime dehydratase